MNVNVNLAFLSLSILYIAFLNVIFLKKGHIKTFELDTFGKLITLNLIGILLEFGCIFTIKYSSSEILIEIVNRLFLLYLVTFVFLFSLYVFSISFDKANKKNNTLRMIIMLMYLFSVFLIFYLKLDIYNKNNIIYSYGPSTNVVYIISTICVILCFVSMIKNYKELKSKKYLPLFVFIIGGSVVALIQKINPALTLATSMEAYLLMIMYHTIENPDMKILEEVHRAKEISDNANEEKTMFLYNMTNEIRNITKDIDYSADDILDETSNKKVDVEVINDAAREIKGSTAKFTTITNEILDVSNMDGASIRVYDEKYNIKLILKSLINTYKKRCDDKNIVFRSNINSDMPEFLYGDGINLKKVIDILLDNSVKYTNDGYVELDVNTIIKNDIVRLIITVEDSGIGIESDKLGSLFVNEKDYKEENYDLNDTLYNVKKIITLMNGTIVPSSIYGTGTKMKIILDQRLVVSDSKLNEYEKVIDKKDVLLIGNLNSKIIKDIVKDKNINLEIIELGKEALDKIRGKKKYDLILIEDNIKPLSGIIIMKKLLMIKSFNTKVILLSSNNEYIDNYDKYGFSDVISEPIDEDIFINKINKYLER